jgi:uncharacterized protein with von Willebrand factor type A (vWA) domain
MQEMLFYLTPTRDIILKVLTKGKEVIGGKMSKVGEVNYYIRTFAILERYAFDEFKIELNELKSLVDEEMSKKNPNITTLSELELKYNYNVCKEICDKFLNRIKSSKLFGLEIEKRKNRLNKIKKEINNSPNLSKYDELKGELKDLKYEFNGIYADFKWSKKQVLITIILSLLFFILGLII